MVKNANEANKPEGKSPNKKEKKKQFMVPKATLRGIERSQILTQNPEWDKTKQKCHSWVQKKSGLNSTRERITIMKILERWQGTEEKTCLINVTLEGEKLPTRCEKIPQRSWGNTKDVTCQ